MKANHNLPEFKKLIERYETITIEEIIDKNRNKIELTGFGHRSTCALCKSVRLNSSNNNFEECNYCIYSSVAPNYEDDYRPCNKGINKDSYLKIMYAENSEQLLTAFRARAAHMRSILKKLNLE